MTFISFTFFVFLVSVFVLYWFAFDGHLKWQNLFLWCVSYIFYGWWDWRFLGLIFLSSSVDFLLGLAIDRSGDDRRLRKRWLNVSLIFNLGLLGFFKYYNFFCDTFISAFAQFGVHLNPSVINVVLPVGISFYTFQSLSYTIDIYRGQLGATTNYVNYMAFVSFFPQLVAGPIERAVTFLPQFMKRRTFDYNHAVSGSRQILWGFFKKMVIADNCAPIVDNIYATIDQQSGAMLILGLVLFSVQVYCDFSGYSDIGLGTARLFGFELMKNFANPFFARNISEFWQRWHISLSTWFRDYIYFPLGGSRISQWISIRNVFIVFIVSGLWHAAKWSFVFWGVINALAFIPSFISKESKKMTPVVAQNSALPTLRELGQMLGTWATFAFSLIFFRADDLRHGFHYITEFFEKPYFVAGSRIFLDNWFLFVGIAFLYFVEWNHRKSHHNFTLEKIPSRPARWAVYFLLVFALVSFSGAQQAFVYFQF